MKRLAIAIVCVIPVLAAAGVAFAQGRDLAGTWVLDTEKSGTTDGPKQIVTTLSAKEFTARFGGETAQVMPFKLDGTETVVTDGDLTRGKTKAVWKGDKLEATVTSERSTETVTFSREGAWLVAEVSSPQHGPSKLFFKKAPGKL